MLIDLKRKHRETLIAYLFLMPSFVILGLFVFWPVGFSFVLSFFKWDFKNMTNPQFSLFANYSEIFRFESPVSHSFLNSLVGSVFILGMSLLISLMIYQALTLKKDKVYWLFLSGLMMVLGFLFRGGSFLRLLFSLSAFAVIALSGVKRTKHIQLFSKHGWLSAFLVIIAFLTWSLADKKIYDLIDYLLEAQEKNLFVKALVNTGYYVLLTVPTTVVLALGVALLLNSNIKLRTFFRTAYFIPFVTSVVAVSLVWKWIFNDLYGLLNYFLSLFGMEGIAWLKDEKWTIPTIAMVSIWKTVGYDAVIFLAGLQNIDKFYYEAAEVDGATTWQKFKHITWPLLSPTTFFLLIVSLISSFKVFTEVYILYDGLPGPYNNSGMTMVYYVFDRFYQQQRMGIACAAAYILFAVILIFTGLQFWAGRRAVEYVS